MYPRLANWHLLRMMLGMNARHTLTRDVMPTDDRSATQSFHLARGESIHLSFVPTSPGYIHATATWTGAALKMQLIRPDGSVAADAIGCSPLTLHFHLRRGEFQRNCGKTYRVVVMHIVVTLAEDAANGEFRVAWGEQPGEASPTPAT
jgi:hypothetical protein